MSRVPPWPGCHHSHGVTVPGVSRCPRCHHVWGVTISGLSPCLGCHCVWGATMSGVPLCPGCHCTQGATAIRYHCVQGATMPRISPCLWCHHAQGATVTRVPLCPGCHHVQGVTMSRMPPWPGCHRARGATITPVHGAGAPGTIAGAVRACEDAGVSVPTFLRARGVCRVCGGGGGVRGTVRFTPLFPSSPPPPHSPPQSLAPLLYEAICFSRSQIPGERPRLLGRAGGLQPLSGRLSVTGARGARGLGPPALPLHQREAKAGE